jgi:TPR repeat protein
MERGKGSTLLDSRMHNGVVSEDEPLEDLIQKANHGDSESMTNLGRRLMSQGELDEAEAWFLKASDSDEEAVRRLGFLYSSKGDIENAAIWHQRAAELGFIGSMTNLGSIFKDRRDLDGAEKWFLKAAEGQSSASMFNLALLYQERGDVDAAEEWYTRAAELGNEGAMTNLVVLNRERGDSDGELRWYQALGVLGNVNAMYSSGIRFLELNQVREAEDWFRRAIELGDTDSLSGLGLTLQNRGDSVGAEHWLQKAVNQGVPRATAALQNLHKVLATLPTLNALTFATFGLDQIKLIENCRMWANDNLKLAEMYHDMPPDYPSWDAGVIRSMMTDFQEYVESPSFDMKEFDKELEALPDLTRKILSRLPESLSVLDVDCFKVQAVKCVSVLTRHRSDGHVHFSASLIILLKECFWILGLEVEDDELVGVREGAVAHLVLDQKESGATTIESFDPYNSRWDGLIPIDEDPLTRVRLLAAELRKSLQLSVKVTMLEPFER